MSKRNKAIFVGTSNTMGLGLELEFSKRYQDDDFLLNKCINIPPVQDTSQNHDTYTDEDIQNHRKYRWSKLVCDYFGLEEINVNDPIQDSTQYFFNESRHAVDVVFEICDNKEQEDIKELLNKTKYIFLEFGYIRWWEHDLHGTNSNYKWPETPREIEMFLKDKNVKKEDKQRAIDWLNSINPIELWKRTVEKIKKIEKDFPDIELVLLCWGVNPDIFNIKVTQDIEHLFLQMPVSENIDYNQYDITSFLKERKLQIKDKVLAYNPKYKDKWLYEDSHANSKGQKIIANQIINKLQNETRGLYTI